MRFSRVLVLAVLASGLSMAAPVSAQPLGTFRWQLQPYCNVVSVAVVQQGGQYQLDGTDDQCGAPQAASVRGLAFLNPNGSIGFGLTIVTAPGGTPVHVEATIAIATLSGTWRDSAGNSGTFTFTPGGVVPGLPPRPVPSGGLAPASITNVQIANNTIGAGQINTAEVQARVSGVCPAGSAIGSVLPNGAVTCVVDGAGPFKRTTFAFVGVPATAVNFGSAVNVTTLTFTAAVTGTAVLSGSGFCNVTSLTTGQTNVLLQAALPTDNAIQLSFVAAHRLPQATTSQLNQFAWSVQRDFPVTAGVSYTTFLKGWHEVGATASTDCSGNFAATIHTSTMP